jgi:uncharacterized protein (TIGR02679 family)
VVNDDTPSADRTPQVSVPPSLVEGDLPDFWRDVAERLERNGESWRGRIQLSPYSSNTGRVLTALVGRPGRKTVELERVEAELARLGVGTELSAQLAALGHPVSPLPAARRTERARIADGRAAARSRAATWPEPWATWWVDDLVRSGLLAGFGRDETEALLHDVRLVLDTIDNVDQASFSRTDLAASAIGSAHALDDGTLLERATARALALRQQGAVTEGVDPWSAIGAYRNLLAGAALTWRLPLESTHPLAEAVQTCDDLRIPFVVTRLALDSVGLRFAPGRDVLVVENPRVVERAAQLGSRQSVVCGNGNPSTTVSELITGLLASDVTVRYHGDFDAAGLEICARMHARGLKPWRMSTADYLEALRDADDAGVRLPLDGNRSGPTPWDPGLHDAFEQHRRVVHEERLLDRILST